jgi:mannan endo-1,4-beta-mannosidase
MNGPMKAAATLAVLLALIGLTPSSGGAEPSPLKTFITRRGDELFDGEKPFRFISVNIPNVQIVEDNFSPGAASAWGWPDEFELNDALESVRQMGGQVVRSYVLSVRRDGSDMGNNVHALAPGKFNEEAFESLDLALEIAGRKGVRVIIPLVDNWRWHGGCEQYAAFRGKPPEAFWTDEQVIGDFEQTIRYVLNRVNTRTGVAYRDDPAIFGWETGNELDSTPEWTRRIASFIKQIDPNHLVIDGYSLHGVRGESLDDPNVDVITTHHYPSTNSDYVRSILAAREATRGKKPYFVGEFGFILPDEIERVYDAVIDSGVSGALLWSLRYHHRDGGFYWHSEPSGGRFYRAYHWPGFNSGEAYGERIVMKLTRSKAYEIRGVPAPPVQPPAPPTLLPIEDVAAISWKGSAGAQQYLVERTEQLAGRWSVIDDNVDDAAVQYRPLFNDTTAEPGSSYYYRVSASNEAGRSTPSRVVGPIEVRHRTLVDECHDLSKLAASTEGVAAATGDDRDRREDASRLAIPSDGSVTYEVPDPIVGWAARAYLVDPLAGLTVAYSKDGRAFSPGGLTAQQRANSTTDYQYLPMTELASTAVPAGVRWLRLSSTGACELSHLDVRYGATKK